MCKVVFIEHGLKAAFDSLPLFATEVINMHIDEMILYVTFNEQVSFPFLDYIFKSDK